MFRQGFFVPKTMDNFFKSLGEFEFALIVVYLAFCKVSHLARLVRDEYRQWHSPTSKTRPAKRK
jgi:hypothetical protein